MASNTAKYLSYAEAWKRIKKAQSQDFPFEVVTLVESILSDRLLSYVRGVDPNSKVGVKTPFATLIKEWRRLAFGKLPVHESSDLGAAVDTWRQERNKIIHGMTKSAPGAPTDPVVAFITRATSTANDGVALAKAVSNWHRSQHPKPTKKKPTKKA